MIPPRPGIAASAADVVERRHSPAGDHRRLGRGGGRREPVDIRAAEQSVAVDVGDHERRRRRESDRVRRRARRPTTPSSRAPRARRCGDRARQRPEPARRRHRRAMGRPPQPIPSRRGSRRRRPSAAASSTDRTPPPTCTDARPATAAATAATISWLTRSPGLGGVEVDDVDPLRAAVAVRHGRRRRRRCRTSWSGRSRPGAAARRARRAGRSTGYSNGRFMRPTGAATPATKLRNRARPALADFSGWNCTANTLPARNATFRSSP